MKPTHVSVTRGLLNSTSGCVFGKIAPLSSMLFSPASHVTCWEVTIYVVY